MCWPMGAFSQGCSLFFSARQAFPISLFLFCFCVKGMAVLMHKNTLLTSHQDFLFFFKKRGGIRETGKGGKFKSQSNGDRNCSHGEEKAPKIRPFPPLWNSAASLSLERERKKKKSQRKRAFVWNAPVAGKDLRSSNTPQHDLDMPKRSAQFWWPPQGLTTSIGKQHKMVVHKSWGFVLQSQELLWIISELSGILSQVNQDISCFTPVGWNKSKF